MTGFRPGISIPPKAEIEESALILFIRSGTKDRQDKVSTET